MMKEEFTEEELVFIEFALNVVSRQTERNLSKKSFKLGEKDVLENTLKASNKILEKVRKM